MTYVHMFWFTCATFSDTLRSGIAKAGTCRMQSRALSDKSCICGSARARGRATCTCWTARAPRARAGRCRWATCRRRSLSRTLTAMAACAPCAPPAQGPAAGTLLLAGLQGANVFHHMGRPLSSCSQHATPLRYAALHARCWLARQARHVGEGGYSALVMRPAVALTATQQAGNAQPSTGWHK